MLRDPFSHFRNERRLHREAKLDNLIEVKTRSGKLIPDRRQPPILSARPSVIHRARPDAAKGQAHIDGDKSLSLGIEAK